jgi:hypothetical protein
MAGVTVCDIRGVAGAGPQATLQKTTAVHIHQGVELHMNYKEEYKTPKSRYPSYEDWDITWLVNIAYASYKELRKSYWEMTK